MSGLREENVDRDPLVQFGRWFAEAEAAMPAPEAVVLATATPDGLPSARMVLAKSFDAEGFVFHTGYDSRKGRELTVNPWAALLYYWAPLGRQVRVEGSVAPTSREDSERYFRSRPPLSRLAALASPQSEVISGRSALNARFEDVRAEHGDDPPIPERWGGFRLRPDVWEFWQRGENRLHDRLRYWLEGDRWVLERLGP